VIARSCEDDRRADLRWSLTERHTAQAQAVGSLLSMANSARRSSCLRSLDVRHFADLKSSIVDPWVDCPKVTLGELALAKARPEMLRPGC
jgi:hypothetical protein